MGQTGQVLEVEAHKDPVAKHQTMGSADGIRDDRRSLPSYKISVATNSSITPIPASTSHDAAEEKPSVAIPSFPDFGQSPPGPYVPLTSGQEELAKSASPTQHYELSQGAKSQRPRTALPLSRRLLDNASSWESGRADREKRFEKLPRYDDMTPLISPSNSMSELTRCSPNSRSPDRGNAQPLEKPIPANSKPDIKSQQERQRPTGIYGDLILPEKGSPSSSLDLRDQSPDTENHFNWEESARGDPREWHKQPIAKGRMFPTPPELPPPMKQVRWAFTIDSDSSSESDCDGAEFSFNRRPKISSVPIGEKASLPYKNPFEAARPAVGSVSLLPPDLLPTRDESTACGDSRPDEEYSGKPDAFGRHFRRMITTTPLPALSSNIAWQRQQHGQKKFSDGDRVDSLILPPLKLPPSLDDEIHRTHARSKVREHLELTALASPASVEGEASVLRTGASLSGAVSPSTSSASSSSEEAPVKPDILCMDIVERQTQDLCKRYSELCLKSCEEITRACHNSATTDTPKDQGLETHDPKAKNTSYSVEQTQSVDTAICPIQSDLEARQESAYHARWSQSHAAAISEEKVRLPNLPSYETAMAGASSYVEDIDPIGTYVRRQQALACMQQVCQLEEEGRRAEEQEEEEEEAASRNEDEAENEDPAQPVGFVPLQQPQEPCESQNHYYRGRYHAGPRSHDRLRFCHQPAHCDHCYYEKYSARHEEDNASSSTAVEVEAHEQNDSTVPDEVDDVYEPAYPDATDYHDSSADFNEQESFKGPSDYY